MTHDPTDDDERTEKVQDDGSVDQKIKNRIIDARNRIDEREDLLFVRAQADPDVQLQNAEALNAWGTCVRQYIRAVEPLLKSDDIQNASYYYYEVPIGHGFEVPPPDNEDGEWSKFAHTSNKRGLCREMGLPSSFDPPKPKEVQFNGLIDVLNRPVIDLSWSFEKHPDSPGSNPVHLEATIPVPKTFLEEAVSHVDEFLQDAGVGLEISDGDPHGVT